jgi:hypothetical protein
MKSIAHRPFSGSGWRVLIVNEADAMTAGAAYTWLDALVVHVLNENGVALLALAKGLDDERLAGADDRRVLTHRRRLCLGDVGQVRQRPHHPIELVNRSVLLWHG